MKTQVVEVPFENKVTAHSKYTVSVYRLTPSGAMDIAFEASTGTLQGFLNKFYRYQNRRQEAFWEAGLAPETLIDSESPYQIFIEERHCQYAKSRLVGAGIDPIGEAARFLDDYIKFGAMNLPLYV